MKTESRKPTRRQFIEFTAAGTVGAAMASMGGNQAEAKTVDKGRAHYRVFQPGKIGKLELKNRMVRSAAYLSTGSKDPETEGEVTDDTIRIHKSYAEGEVSMTMTGYMNVMDFGKKFSHVSASHDRFVPGLARMAEAIHGVGNGCKLVAEIGHDGTSRPSREGFINTMLSPTGEEWPTRISPSGWNLRGEEDGHALTVKEIERFTSDMGNAARRLKEAGWDGCNIHGTHWYLINTFMSPLTNKRTDKYGGTMYKRLEIVRECVQKIRAGAGDDFAIIIKVSCDDGSVDDGVPEAQDMTTFPSIAKMLEDLGVDALDISGFDPIRRNCNTPEDQSYYQEYTAKLDNLKIPVMLSGGNRDVELLEDIMKKQDGNLDYYCFARPLLRQPHLIKQWLEGGESKSTCTNVTLCFPEMGRPPFRPAHCVVQRRLDEAKEKAQTSFNQQGQPTIYGV